MEKLTYNHSTKILALLGVFSLFYSLRAFGLDTKRFDAPPPERPSYLTFAKPTPLRFSISPLPVDRLKLILPPKPIVQKAPSPLANLDDNASSGSPGGIVTSATPDANASTAPRSYPQMPSPFLPQLAPPDSLPLSDPFENLNSFDVDSTDELLRILESSDGVNPASSLVPTPFVPPFTVASDGMRISSKATYRRVER
jgi:hypothetical protein